MPYAETQAECARQRDAFVRLYRKTDSKAVDTLLRDWDRMVTFYAFPKDHWIHLRTTNIVESPFASVRLRTDASLQARRGGPGHHLEDAPGRRAGVATTQCAGGAAASCLRCAVQRREDEPVRRCEVYRERSGREDRRLIPFTHLLTRPLMGHFLLPSGSMRQEVGDVL